MDAPGWTNLVLMKSKSPLPSGRPSRSLTGAAQPQNLGKTVVKLPPCLPRTASRGFWCPTFGRGEQLSDRQDYFSQLRSTHYVSATSLSGEIPSSSESFSPKFVSLALSSETVMTPLFCLSIMDKAVKISFSGSSCFVCLYIMFRKVEKSSSAFRSGGKKKRADSLRGAQCCSPHPALAPSSVLLPKKKQPTNKKPLPGPDS